MFGNNNPPGKGSNPNESTNMNKNVFGFNQMPQSQNPSQTTEQPKFTFNLASSSSSSGGANRPSVQFGQLPPFTESNRTAPPLYRQISASFTELNTNKKSMFGNTVTEGSSLGFTTAVAGPPIQYQNQPKVESAKIEQPNIFSVKNPTFSKPFGSTVPSIFGGNQPQPFTTNSSQIHQTGSISSNPFGRSNQNPFGNTQSQQSNPFGGSKQTSATSVEPPPPLFPQFATPRETAPKNLPPKPASVFSGLSSSTPAPSIFGGHNITYVPKKQVDQSDLAARSESIAADKMRIQKPLMEVEVLKKSEVLNKSEALNDPRFKKPHLNRPKLNAGLFSQALAGIRPSKSKEMQKRLQSREKKDNRTSHKLDSSVASSEEIAQLKSIVCHGIPPDYMSGDFLRNHFSKFGKVTKLYPNHAKGSAVVHFQTHGDAANAKEHGIFLDPEMPQLNIFWSLSSLTRKKQTSKPKNAPQKMEESSEVNEELRSMAFNTSELEEQYSGNSKKEKKSPVKVKHERPVEPIHRFTHEQTDLLKSQAKNSKEKFQILDLRDKILRTNRIKQSNIRTARAIVGTCPDMCPEKERYLREDGGRLPFFEISTSGESQEIDHKAAIKEYSRSSADQEEPLPHELRPIAALSMTMDYLVCNVMDSFEKVENSAEWYDFLWNRTRAIRKDLTQQHLCDLNSVALVEKCARFHIHCAERLCEEDAISFDQKINNENLTKCLQTLKHFYHDLQLKNVQCPCEDEFRGYDILLNLNLGDILRQVQQLSLKVQKSEPVAFAVKVFGALNSNNYVRFFKLVRSATYLNACLLHRYFNQVRSRALHVLIRAYSVFRATYFSLQEFTYLLGFENENDAADFCTLHALIIEDGHVIFDKGTFDQPNAIPLAKRAQTLIENKRSSLVGEIVNAGPLPPNPAESYQPHSSFDSNGYLRTDAILAEDQVQVSGDSELTIIDVVELPQKIIEEDDEVVIISQSSQLDVNLNEMIRELARELFGEVTNEMVVEMVRDNIDYFVSLKRTLNEIVTEIVDEDVVLISRNTCKNVISEEVEEAKHLEKIRLVEEHEKREIRSRAEMTVGEQLINDILNSEVMSCAADIFHEMKAEQHENDIVNSSKQIASDLVNEVTRIEIRNVCETVHQEDVVTVREKLKSIADRIRLLKARRYLHLWRRTVIKRKRKRRNLKSFPCVPGLLAHQMLAIRQDEVRNATLSIERLKTQQNLLKLMDVSYYSHQLEAQMKQLPLDVCSLVAPILLRSSKAVALTKYSTIFHWKLVLSLPSTDGHECNNISELLISKLSSSEFHKKNNKQIGTINISYSDKEKTGYPFNFGVCVTKMIGVLNDFALNGALNTSLLKGTNVVLFIIYCVGNITHEFWETQQKRFAQVLTLHNGNPCPAFGILVFTSEQNTLSKNEVVAQLNLRNILPNEKYFICNYTNVQPSFLSKQLTVCIERLAKSTSLPTGFRRQSLMDFLDNVITKYFLEPIYHNLSTRSSLGFVHQPIDVLVTLFNSVITHVAKVLTSQSLQNLSWPAKEFVSKTTDDSLSLNWNDEANFSRLLQTIKQLILPEFEFSGDVNNWTDVKENIFHYLNGIVDRKIGDLGLKSRIEKLIYKREIELEKDCCIKFRIANCQPTFENMLWTDFIQIIASYRTHSINNQNQFVYYFEDELAAFKFPLVWKRAINNNKTPVSYDRFLNLQNSALKRKNELSFQESTKPRKRFRSFSVVNETKTNRNLDQVRRFLSQLKAEREETRLHGQQLQEAILGTTFPLETSTPVCRPRKQLQEVQVLPPHQRTRSEDSVLQNYEKISPLSLNEKIRQLQLDLESEKQKNKLFDIRFQMVFTNLR